MYILADKPKGGGVGGVSPMAAKRGRGVRNSGEKRGELNS